MNCLVPLFQTESSWSAPPTSRGHGASVYPSHPFVRSQHITVLSTLLRADRQNKTTSSVTLTSFPSRPFMVPPLIQSYFSLKILFICSFFIINLHYSLHQFLFQISFALCHFYLAAIFHYFFTVSLNFYSLRLPAFTTINYSATLHYFHQLNFNLTLLQLLSSLKHCFVY